MQQLQLEDIKSLVRLVPNGINESGHFKFSLILAIDSKKDAYHILTYNVLHQVALKLGTLMNTANFLNNFGVYLKDKNQNIVELKISNVSIKQIPFNINENEINQHWNNFFGQVNDEGKQINIILNKFKIEDDFTNPDNDFDFLYQDVECCNKPQDECNVEVGEYNSYIPECGSKDDLLNRIDAADQIFNQVETFVELEGKNKIERYRSRIDLKTNMLFSDILTQLYLHKKVATDNYGVCLDLECDISSQDNNTTFNKTWENLILTNKTGDPFLQKESDEDGDINNEPILSIYTNYCINKVQILGQIAHKWYHGRTNYGLVPLKPSQYEWQFLSKIQNWNNQLATTNDGLDAANTEKVEAIILYHKFKAKDTGELSKKEYEKIFMDDGIEGHEIVCLTTDGTNSQLASLCEKETRYSDTNNVQFNSVTTRSSIKIDTSIVAGSNSDIKPNELFKFEGYNLCLPKSDEDKLYQTEKQKSVSSSVTDDDRDNPYFENFFDDHGFSFKNTFIQNSNIWLNDISQVIKDKEKQYWFFIIKSDAVTGHKISLHSTEGSLALSLKDILKNEELMDKYGKIPFKDPNNPHKESIFKIDPVNSPLYPVAIIDNKPHKNLDDPSKNNSEPLNSVEQHDVIVLNEDYQSTQRWLYPPSITAHFAQLLALTDASFVKPLNNEDYLKKVYAIYQRAKLKIPKIYLDEKIRYLPDFRVTKLILKPDNWYTWMVLRHNNQNEMTIEQAFHYNRNFKNFFNDLKPKKISFIDNQRTICYHENNICVDFNKPVAEIHIPKNEELKLRFYSADSYHNTKQFLNFNVFDVINIEANVDAPKIINYSQPIEADRCFPKNIEQSTYSFYEFTVENDPRRDYITLLTESDEIIDDGITTPNLKIPYISRLETQIINEYQRSIFKTKVGDINNNESKDVFPNLFGFTFSLPYIINRKKSPLREKIDSFSENTIILSFQLNTDNSIQFKKDQEGVYLCHIGKNGERILMYPDLDKPFEAVVKYSFSLENGLVSQLFYFDNYDNEWKDITERTPDKTPLQLELPANNLSHRDIILNEIVEETLVANILSYDYFQLRFLNYKEAYNRFTITENPKYFVYRDEEHNKYKRQKFRLKAYSKFSKYYPSIENFTAVSHELQGEFYEAIIRNNTKPEIPVFNMVPLFAKAEIGNLKTTGNPIFIRIERPQSEDYIGVVDAVLTEGNYTTGIETSSLVRDITKNIEEDEIQCCDRLSHFLNFDSDHSKHYIEKKECELLLDGRKYKSTLFRPHYNKKEDQYQILLDFDYSKFKHLDDPMLKLVLVRVQENSIKSNKVHNKDKFKVSKFSNAKFIPVRSERSVQLKKCIESNNKFNLLIHKNGAFNYLNYENSLFIICCFKKNKAGLINVSLNNTAANAKPYLLNNTYIKDGLTFYILSDNFEEIGSIGVFEVEKHEELKTNVNLIKELDSGSINFNNHPHLRIIYYESLNI